MPAKARYDYEARDKTGKASKSAQGNLQRVNAAAVAVGTAIGNMIASAVRSLPQFIGSLTQAAAAADVLAKKARGLGMSTQELEHLENILAFSGGSPEKAGQFIDRLIDAQAQAKQGVEAYADAMTALGGTADMTMEDMDELFLDIVANWKGTNEEVEAATIVFGRKMAAEIRTVAASYDDARKRADGLAQNNIFTNEKFIAESETFQDNMHAIGRVLDKLKSTEGAPILEALNNLAENAEAVLMVISKLQDLGQQTGEGTAVTALKAAGGFIEDNPEATRGALEKALERMFELSGPGRLIQAHQALSGAGMEVTPEVVTRLMTILTEIRDASGTNYQ